MENKNQEFESLLKESFLHLDFEKQSNSKLLENIRKSVFERKSIWTKPKKFYLGIGLVLILASLSYFLLDYEKIALSYHPHQIKITPEKAEKHIPHLRKINSASFITLEDSPQGKPLKAEKLTYDITSFPEKEKDSIKVYHGQEVFELPELTESQIKEHEQAKADFLKDIAKLKDQRLQDFKVAIEDSTYNLAVWKGEVTNSEYRIFLNDLILRKEKAKYLKARIDSEMWVKSFPESFIEPYKEMYAWHPAYQNYPVVNINVKGAEFYCDWLTAEIMKLEKNKNSLIKARLMDYQEWQYIYTSGGKYKPYPWGGPHLRNEDGEYLANYRPFKNDYVSDKALTTINSKSYYPNELGLYNLAGNVAEWIELDEIRYAAMGGSWSDPAHHMRFDAKVIDTVKAAHPTIGFRPVIELE